jgi:hypothetical protein
VNVRVWHACLVLVRRIKRYIECITLNPVMSAPVFSG